MKLDRSNAEYLEKFMAKKKDIRITIVLECISCDRRDNTRTLKGISRYTTEKNRRTTVNRLELKKFCCCCLKHTIHRELKK
jgi:large subunit ribosomal protein L33|nr:ribosomal protein L33 [Equisetum ramosissimum]